MKMIIEKLAIVLSREYENDYLTTDRMAEHKLMASFHTFGTMETEKAGYDAMKALIKLGRALRDAERN